MLRTHLRLRLVLGAIAMIAAAPAFATAGFVATDLVTSGGPTPPGDPSLINPWGVSYAPTGPFWVSDNGTGLSTLYNGAGVKQGLVVTIPAAPGNSGHSAPTGQVFTGGAGFGGNVFAFATEDGTITGWKLPGTVATILADNSAADYGPAGIGAVYKGLALGSDHNLYAANFREGKIDIFSNVIGGNGMLGSLGTINDPNAPVGYAPFNVQNLNGTLYVTYAKRDASGHDDVAGAGNGFVDAFNTSTGTWTRIANGSGVAPGGLGSLNSPWGLAIAPTSFGPTLAGALLVGNFGSGEIDAFDPTTHAYLGQLTKPDGSPLVLDGLWALTVGNDANAGSSQTVYFTAGPADESAGVFGAINAVPEPGTTALMTLGGLILLAGRRLRRRS